MIFFFVFSEFLLYLTNTFLVFSFHYLLYTGLSIFEKLCLKTLE